MEETKNETNQETNMDSIKEYGQAVLSNQDSDHQIHLLNIIGEIEGEKVKESNVDEIIQRAFWKKKDFGFVELEQRGGDRKSVV